MSLHFSLSEQALKWVYLFYIQSKRFLPDNFISNETGQVGWAKIEEKKLEETHGTPASRTWLVSHMPLVGPEL